MKNIITVITLSIALLFATCQTEPDVFFYTVTIKNTANHLLNIEAYSNHPIENELIFSNILDYGENSNSCEYWQEFLL